MKKELNCKSTNIYVKRKKVDLRVSNKKYSLTFNQTNRAVKGMQEPVVLGINDQSEVRLMVDDSRETKEDIANLVKQIKETFQDYLLEMERGEFKSYSFKDILFNDVCQHHSYAVQVDIMKDHLLILHDKMFVIKYKDVKNIYVEKRSDVSKSFTSQKDGVKKYVLLYDYWIMVEVENQVFEFSGNEVEQMFSALSKVFFMAQVKQINQNKKGLKNE